MMRIPVLLLFLCALATPAAATTLRVLGATDTAAFAGVIADFEAAHPGIEVQYEEFNTVELHDRVRQTPGADVVISSAMDLQVRLVNLGLARRLAIPPGDPDWPRWRDELYGFTYEPAALVYNRAAFEGLRLPRTRSELAGMIRDAPERFRARIGTYDIRRSGVGYLFATQDAIRDHQYFRLVESFGRAEARTYCCTSEMIAATASGELALGYNVIAPYALAAARADPRIGVHFLEDYTLVMSRAAFVPRTAPNPEAAERFVAFLLSDAGQRSIAEHSDLMPLTAAGTSIGVGPSRFIPIRLAPGLLAYLDTMKHRAFLKSWEQAMGIER